MIKFYYHPTPNPAKVALFLEEAGLDYELIPVDTRRGDQHQPEYKAINPNAKTPALVDGDAVLFDSTAILLHLAHKTGQFLGSDAPADRAQLLSWLMLIATGIGPYTGQYVHFRYFAPEPKDYPLNRYEFEAERHWGLLEAQLGDREWLVGDSYTIVDISFWGWGRAVPFIFAPEGWERFPNLKRHFDAISARPAAVRAAALAERHDFKKEMDDEARAIMFPQNARLATANKEPA